MPLAWHSWVTKYALFRNACRSGPLDTVLHIIITSGSLHMHAPILGLVSLLLPLLLPLLLLLLTSPFLQA